MGIQEGRREADKAKVRQKDKKGRERRSDPKLGIYY